MGEINKQIIFFDGICNLCNSSVDFFVRNSKKSKRFYIASLQSKTAAQLIEQHEITDLPDSILFYYRGKFHYKSTAVLLIAKFLKFPLNLLVIFFIIPRFIRDWIYDGVAKNRYKWFGQKNTCRIPTTEEQDFFLD